MTRTLATATLLALASICAAYWSAPSTDAVSSSMRTIDPGVLTAPQSPSPTPTPTPRPVTSGSLPVVSPDGSRIAFTSNRTGAPDLFVIDANGTNERQLTNTPEDESNLAWTRDGKQILFAVFKDDISRLYAIDPDGKNQRELAKVPGRAPTLSPDGKRLVYMEGTWTATRLMVSALDGSNAKQITDGSSIAWNNHWSPDGKRIAFTGRNDPKGELAVFVMNADGSSRHQVTHVPAEEGGAQWPVWSPNGRQLAIQVNSRAQKNTAHIWIVDVASGAAQKLAAHIQAYLDETPSWFPDGKRIAFQSNRTGKMEVWVMNADGSEPRQVTGVSQPAQRPIRNGFPRVSPRDDSILFTSNRDGANRLYLMTAADGATRALTPPGIDASEGQWSSNGVEVVYLILGGSAKGIHILSLATRVDALVPNTENAQGVSLSPDGRQLVYAGSIGREVELHVINRDGAGLQVLTSEPRFHSYPVWSPDGTQIAFTRGTGDGPRIFVMNADGSNVHRVSALAVFEEVPTWSPDGRRLSFQGSVRGSHSAHLYIASADGREVTQVTSHSDAYLDETPSWFPDGKRIAFQSNRTGKMEVWVMNADGSGQRQVTGITQPVAPQQAVTFGGDPRVSPDGSRILFISNRTGVYQIYAMRADGSRVRQLTNGSSGSFLGNWSPDGKRIVFYRESPSQIVIMNADGTARRVISEAKGDQLPSWSEDGSKILFAAGTFPNINIFTMNVDGGDRRNISPNPGFDYDPAWSPDGKTIALVIAVRGQGPRVWLMNADGTNRRRVTNSVDAEERPAWSRDGRYLAFQSAKRGGGPRDAYIHVVDIQTGADRRLGNHDKPYLDETPSWFPDGRRIAFQSDRTGRTEIWVMNADGSGQRLLQNRER